MTTKKISQDKIDYIVANFETMCIKDIAKELGVCYATVEKYARENGKYKSKEYISNILSERISISKDKIDYIVSHYENTTNPEIAKTLGVGEATVSRYGRMYGKHKSPELLKAIQQKGTERAKVVCTAHNYEAQRKSMKHLHEIGRTGQYFQKGVNNLERYGAENEKKRIENCVKSRVELLKSERRRVLFGLPQKTRLKFDRDKKKSMNRGYYRWQLRKRGYIFERGALTLYYTDATNRSEKMEQNSAKYGFRFVALADKDKPKDFVKRTYNAGDTYTGYFNFL